MTYLILRFRDLMIPSGETIARHRSIIESQGEVWWGWMSRNKEIFPEESFRTLSKEMTENGLTALLFDSGSDEFFRAIVEHIYAVPGDVCATPDPARTPPYMAEARLSAWFKVTNINPNPIENVAVEISEAPTLGAPKDAQKNILGHRTVEELRRSDPTLWIGGIVNSNG